MVVANRVRVDRLLIQITLSGRIQLNKIQTRRPALFLSEDYILEGIIIIDS